MIWRGNLGRQITLSMAGGHDDGVSVHRPRALRLLRRAAHLLSRVGERDGWWPSSTEFLVLAGLACLALIAGLASLKRRRATPRCRSTLWRAHAGSPKGDFATLRPFPAEETAQLFDFNTMAQRLQSSAEDMAAWNAAIAHELRSPLTILRGTLQASPTVSSCSTSDGWQDCCCRRKRLSLVDDLRVVTLAEQSASACIAPVEVSK